MAKNTETYAELSERYERTMGFPPRDRCADRATLLTHMAQRKNTYSKVPPGSLVGPMQLPASYCREQVQACFTKRASSSKLKDPRTSRKN